jgi:hypothetical protein
MKTPATLLLVFFLLYNYSCSTKTENYDMPDKIKTELAAIDSLLRDTDYNALMAQTLEAAYYIGTEQPVMPFLAPGEDTAMKKKSAKEDKIATNIAGFYALECGIGWLSSQTNETPVVWLRKIVDGTIDSASIAVLNRFANATWKAGQPFRGLERLKRSTFTCFNFLPENEIKKDYDQYMTAAAKLLSAMQHVSDSNTDAQMHKLKELMQDENFTVAMADSMHVGYYTREQRQAPAFLTPEDDTATISKSVKEEKIATNVAGFYALECGLNYFAAKNILPSDMLKSIVDSTINNDDKMLLQRFANATWKAGQPFRSLDRIHRDNFVPFYFLDEAEIEKDWIQIKAAAEKLLTDISSVTDKGN